MYVGLHWSIGAGYKVVFPNQGSVQHRSEFREKSWNMYKYINILEVWNAAKNFKYTLKDKKNASIL
jgi:hypothetical protein